MVDKPKILSPYEIYSVHTPEVSPHTIEHVICVFLVGVRFGVGVCGFWLVPDLLSFLLFTT